MVTGRYHRLPKSIEDDYALDQKVLGTGYNGSVHLARKSDVEYAVKAFKLHGVPKHKKEELETECEIFLAMDHPHVARLVDVYESHDTLNLVMECMQGGELFTRVQRLKRFSEAKALDAAYQMLLAIKYIHSHDIVHRDIKLENFLFDKQDSNHLKLIDFGFSKVWDHNVKMAMACGTLAYVSPDVLNKNYTSQCDLWSFGVVVFILLVGYMPFGGTQERQMQAITEGRYVIKKNKWAHCSNEASDFVSKLLVVDPDKRLTAEQALQHPWLEKREELASRSDHVNTETCEALVNFAQASVFRRACMSVMAWSLSNEETEAVRDAFLELDTDHTGEVTLAEFKEVMMKKFQLEDAELQNAFQALDTTHTDKVHYSDFLAAMMASRIQLHDDLLISTFKRFDVSNTGYITAQDLTEILGPHYEGSDVSKLLAEADVSHDGRIDLNEFIAYLKGCDVSSSHAEAANKIVDHALINDNEAQARKHEHRAKGLTQKSWLVAATESTVAHKGTGRESHQPKKQQCCVVL